MLDAQLPIESEMMQRELERHSAARRNALPAQTGVRRPPSFLHNQLKRVGILDSVKPRPSANEPTLTTLRKG